MVETLEHDFKDANGHSSNEGLKTTFNRYFLTAIIFRLYKAINNNRLVFKLHITKIISWFTSHFV